MGATNITSAPAEPTASAPSTQTSENSHKSLDGISQEVGLEYCCGDTELYSEVLKTFLTHNLQTVSKLKQACSQGDTDTLAHIAHSTVSSAGTIGAHQLSQAARTLHDAVKNNEPADKWKPLLDNAVRCFDQVITGLKLHFQ